MINSQLSNIANRMPLYAVLIASRPSMHVTVSLFIFVYGIVDTYV